MYRNICFIVEHLDNACVPYILHGNDKALWREASIDSRKCNADSFFIGLRGETYNGGDFVHDAVSHGARVLLVEHAYASTELIKELKNKKGAIICVENAREAFEKLAHSVRMREGKNTIVIGVTGSAGKTTTKQMLRSLLDATGSEGNLNTVQGLCLSIINAQWGKEFDAERTKEKASVGSYAVFECGISYENEMQILARILQPDCALITNVGSAHVGNFSSPSRLQDEKLAIARYMNSENILWLPEDDEMLLQKAKALSCTVRTHGFKSCKSFVSIQDRGVLGSVLYFENEQVITLRVPSLVNARNAVTAIGIADFFSIPRKKSIMALEQISGLARRYEIAHKNPLIVDDSYNANTNAMVEAISWFVKNTSPPYLFVLGGMKELGARSVEEHRIVVDSLLASISQVRNILQSVRIVLVGTEYDEVHMPHEHICMRVRSVDEVYEYIKSINAEYQKYGVDFCSFSILLKGSNAYALDTVIDFIITLSKRERSSMRLSDKTMVNSYTVQ